MAYALDVSPDTDGIEIDRDLTLWRDTSRSATIDQAVSTLQHGGFASPQGMARSRGYSRDAWWFRFQLNNRTDNNLPVRIEYTDGLIGRVSLYSRPAGSQLPWRAQDFANSETEASRPLPTIRPAFPETLPPHAQQEYLMRVVFNDHADMAGPIYSAVRIWSHSAFARANTHEMFLLGGMIGMMALVAFAAFIGFAATRDKAFLYYALNLVMLTVSFHSATGVWPLLLWNGHFSYTALFFCSGIYYICAAQFVRHYLQTNKLSRTLDYALLAIAVIGGISSLGALTGHAQFALEALNLGGIGFLIYIAASIKAIRARIGGAWLFLAAWATYSVSLVVTWGLRDYGLIEHTAFTYRFIFYGIIIEMLLFSVAMALRVRDLRQRKEAAETAYRLHLEAQAGHLEALVQQRTAELETARYEAEAANRAKTTFLAHVSHEIRTPLTAILGYVERLQDERALTTPQAQWLSRIGDSGDYLLSLIGNVLDASKLEAGHVKLYETPMSISTLVRQLHGLFHEQAARRGLAFGISVEAHGWYRLDANKWRQILVNLIGNAIKLTDEGSVSVHLAHEERADGHWLSAHVSDTGPGISRQDAELVFAPFEQAAAGRRAGGAGLGLSICRDFARLMGGHIQLASEPGIGTTFSVHVPVTPTAAAEERSPVARWQDKLEGRTVLIAEDQPINRDLLSDILTRAGATVLTAEDGIDALGVWRAHPEIDTIAADFHMPFMNGVQFARSVRKLNFNGLFLLVSAGHSLDEAELTEAGVDRWIGKPFTRNALLEAVAGKPRSGSPIPPSSQPLNLEEAAEALGYDIPRAMTFARRGLDRIAALMEAFVDDTSPDDRIRHAHSAKGIAGQIGSNRLMQALARLEQTPEADRLAAVQLELAAAEAALAKRQRDQRAVTS
ncbi:hybrid sensor histidine kinase/response regulator [Amantichitinum ursilacus]|nr:hybrid sensor histidine kinase/response regulator [Amantichitinum ursilacus]